ncbi:MAG: sugar phosphate isomerase/epimerase [Acidobacteriaceae bacterium]|nr:sugar phosphate isomerase/epimerase [Acidobacteriaceae bacterium]MBV8571868.1 sugar phosphate isomerase/epimerase [Acidobacteriaceae bacterium]
MSTRLQLSRRGFVIGAAAAPVAGRLFARDKKIPVGLELYSVRGELAKDPQGTLQGVAKMGYECVEFFAPYYQWTPEQAKEIRKQLDDVKLKCYSTHNGEQSFTPEGLSKAIELNKILGTRFIVLSSPGRKLTTLDEYKQIADMLNRANNTMSAEGLHAGYHNHDAEWKPIDGTKPMVVIADNTDKSIMLQLDVGTCIEAGSDPVAWINSHPGRIKSLHLKEWSPQQGYKPLFGEGVAPWKEIFAAAEKKGGVEYYLIEQEGSRFPEMETADRCLIAYRDLRAKSA